ncbi:flagellar hook-length control protein FliK [Savagea faecisuis]|uniref:Flagellar hook-length control protein FliK n=1 Tax=Savagea faecisuis TaxID=1274803 RepID=A0ABW3H257_9BACL
MNIQMLQMAAVAQQKSAAIDMKGNSSSKDVFASVMAQTLGSSESQMTKLEEAPKSSEDVLAILSEVLNMSTEELEQLLPELFDEEFATQLTELIATIPYQASLDDVYELLKSSDTYNELITTITNALEGLVERLTEQQKPQEESVLSLGDVNESSKEQLIHNIEQLIAKLRGEQAEDQIEPFWNHVTQLTEAIELLQQQGEELPFTEEQVAQFAVIAQYIQHVAPQADMHVIHDTKLQNFQQMMQQFVQTEAEQLRLQVESKPKTGNQQLLSSMNQPSATSVFFQTLTQVESPEQSRAEELMKQLQAILKRANFGQIGGANRLSIRLYPEHLGTLRIELQEVNGVLTARILASSAQARDMLDSRLHQLRAALVSQNLQVERIELSQMLQASDKTEREQLMQQDTRHGATREETEETEEEQEDEKSFAQFLIDLEQEEA